MTERNLLIEHIPEFAEALQLQLYEDQKRWGDTWRHRIKEGQEARIWEHIQTYFDQFKHANVPIPWLKIAGLALIAWMRENHPEFIYEEGELDG
jgi:hypothetical protein